MVTGVARANHSKGNGKHSQEDNGGEEERPPPLDAQPMIVPGSIQLGVEK